MSPSLFPWAGEPPQRSALLQHCPVPTDGQSQARANECSRKNGEKQNEAPLSRHCQIVRRVPGVAQARVGCSPAAGAGANQQPEEEERFHAAGMLLLLLYSLLAVTYQILLLISSLQEENFTDSSPAKHCVEDCHFQALAKGLIWPAA